MWQELGYDPVVYWNRTIEPLGAQGRGGGTVDAWLQGDQQTGARYNTSAELQQQQQQGQIEEDLAGFPWPEFGSDA